MKNKQKTNISIPMDCHHLSWGLFGYKGIRWYRRIKNNIHDFFILLKRIKFTIKNGYSPVAKWEMDCWFVCALHDILQRYNDERWGYPGRFVSDDSDNLQIDDGDKLWGEEVKHAIELLEKYYSLYVNGFSIDNVKDANNRMIQMKKIKKEFFKWFSDNLEDLWD